MAVNGVGGIAGYVWVDQNGEYYLKNSYNEGNITGESCVGGITSTISTSATNSNILVTLSNCYNKGIITGRGAGRVGGVVGIIAGKISVEYSYNLGEINNTGGINIGGVVGVNRISTGASSDIKPTINYCYNSADVISTGSVTGVGGLVGSNQKYACVKNCRRLITAEVKNGSTVASTAYGSSSNNYTGRLIGNCYDTNAPYIENVYNWEEEGMTTVYNVVNGLSDEESTYWSNTDVNAPELLWEK